MDNNRSCPLCGVQTVGGVCPGCGYVVSDSDELDYMTHVMDLEPENYPAPEPEPKPISLEKPQNELLYGESDVFPPRYAEEQKNNINIQAARFSQPPVQNNNFGGTPQQGGIRIDYHAPQYNGEKIDSAFIKGKITETAVKALESRYKIPIIIAFEVLCPAILLVVLGFIMKNSADPRVSDLGSKTLLVALLRFATGTWFL